MGKQWHFRNYIEAPKSANAHSKLLKLAAECGIDIETETAETGLIFKKQTVFFKVSSPEKNRVETFAESFTSGCDEYNSSIPSGFGV